MTVVGNLYPVKGHRYLLDAAPRILARCPSTVFVFAGRGDCEADLREQARHLGIATRVRFLGLRRDVPALLSTGDVFVQPSLSEGLSIAILEAMAAAKPVVTTRVGGNPELVADGETGLLVEPKDAGALAAAVIRVLTDAAEARRLGGQRTRAGQELLLHRWHGARVRGDLRGDAPASRAGGAHAGARRGRPGGVMSLLPAGKRFAFSVLDDTDDSTLENVGPLYAMLRDFGFRTTKTVWPLDCPEGSRNFFAAETLQDKKYLGFVHELADAGFEIAFHGATMESSRRERTLEALELIRQRVRELPAALLQSRPEPGEPLLGFQPLPFGAARLLTRALRREDGDAYEGDRRGITVLLGRRVPGHHPVRP